MSNKSKTFELVVTSDSAFAYQDLKFNEVVGFSPPAEGNYYEPLYDLSKKVLIQNASNIDMYVKVMNEKEGDGDDSEGIFLRKQMSIVVKTEKDEEPFFRVGAKLNTAGSGSLYISPFAADLVTKFVRRN